MAVSFNRKESVTPDDVRTVQFDRHRPGYHMEQVDQFLDLVAETLDRLAELEAVRQAGDGEPHLYDPEGAASRLLAAAQATIDTMVHESETYALSTRSEADAYKAELVTQTDDYAGATRSEADGYASDVRGQADAHATAVKSAAAEEARKLAEDTRAQLVEEMRQLEATRDQLEADNRALQSYLVAEQERLASVLDGLRTTVVAADLRLSESPEISGASVDQHTFVEVPEDFDQPASESYTHIDQPTQAVPVPVFDQDDALDQDGGFDQDLTDLPQPVGDPVLVAEPEMETDADLSMAHELAGESESVFADAVAGENSPQGDEAMDAAVRSVFDLEPDQELAPEISLVDDDSDDELFGSGQTIDLDAEPQWGADTETDDGDRFIAELRSVDVDTDDDDAFGPVDDRTETAMSAFFDESDSHA